MLAQGVSPGFSGPQWPSPERAKECFAPLGLGRFFPVGDPGLTPWAKMFRPSGAKTRTLLTASVAMTDSPLHALTRRHFFRDCAVGVGKVALASLLAESAVRA